MLPSLVLSHSNSFCDQKTGLDPSLWFWINLHSSMKTSWLLTFLKIKMCCEFSKCFQLDCFEVTPSLLAMFLPLTESHFTCKTTVFFFSTLRHLWAANSFVISLDTDQWMNGTSSNLIFPPYSHEMSMNGSISLPQRK